MNRLLQFFCALLPFMQAEAQTIINNYSPVTLICGLLFTLEESGPFNIGDSVLVIQMQGADIRKDQNASFGEILSIGNAGNYEFNKIAEKNGNVVTLKYKPQRNFDVPGKVQMITVPDYKGTTTLGNLTCLPWDGKKGGVLVFTAETLVLNGNLDVSGKGFRRGIVRDSSVNHCPHDNINYFLPELGSNAGQKGEGIFFIQSPQYKRAAGKTANGGGGGNQHNAGGGGGSNAGRGGNGGHWTGCADPDAIPGQGGTSLQKYYSETNNRVFMGGGGGAGHSNNLHGTSGGNGGGIIILSAFEILGNGHLIKANGDAPELPRNPDDDGPHDGGGGGGAGGAILLALESSNGSTLSIEANGAIGSTVREDHGQGGGGGGGAIRLSKSITSWSLEAAGGEPGQAVNGASSGFPGITTYNLVLPQTTDPSPPLSFSTLTSIAECDGSATIILAVKGAIGTVFYSIDGGNTRSLEGIFKNQTAGTYKAFAEDECGTIRANLEAVTYPPLAIAPFIQPFICDSFGSLVPNLTGGKPPFSFWLGTRPKQNAPLFKNLRPGTYPFLVRDERGCGLRDTFEIENLTDSIALQALPQDTTIISGDAITLSARAETPFPEHLFYTWQPSYGLSDAHAHQPVFRLNESAIYYLTVRDSFGCIGRDSLTIKVRDDTLYFPNIFSPNAQNPLNATFGPVIGYRTATVVRFQIFNRWGNMVFERRNFQTGDPTGDWDGTFQGRALPPGVFTYMAEVKFLDERTKIYHGNVTLFR